MTLCSFCPLNCLLPPLSGLPHQLSSPQRCILGFWDQCVLRLLSFLKIQTLQFAFRWSYTDPVSEVTAAQPGPNRPDYKNEVHSIYNNIHNTKAGVHASHQSAVQGKCLRNITTLRAEIQMPAPGVKPLPVTKINLLVTAKYHHVFFPTIIWVNRHKKVVSVRKFTIKCNLGNEEP